MFNKILTRLETLTFYQLFALLSIAGTLFLGIKYFSQKYVWRTIKIEVVNKDWVNSYNPYGYRTPFWLSDKLKTGQKEYDKSGKVIAEILNVENYERGSEEAEAYITLKVKTTFQKRSNQYVFKNKPLELGSPIDLVLDNNAVPGQVIDNNYPEAGYPTKQVTITARARAVEPQIYNNIKVGDKMFERYQNISVAEILSLYFQKPSRIYVENTNNFLSVKSGQEYKDVLIKLKVNVCQFDQRWYFAGHQNIKVGNSFYFYSPTINLYNLEIENVE